MGGAFFVVTVAGWLACLLMLATEVEAGGLGIVLGTVLCAEATAALLSWSARQKPVAANGEAQAVGLLGWIGCCVLVISASQIDALALYHDRPSVALLLLALMLGLYLLNSNARPRMIPALRTALWAFAWGAIAYVDDLTIEASLSAAVFVVVLLLALDLKLRDGRMIKPESAEALPVALWSRSIDLVAVPFLLPPAAATVYLLARIFAAGAFVAADKVVAQALPQLSAQTFVQRRGTFRANAARLNLGMLLVAGGLAVGLLAVGNASKGLLPEPFDAINTAVPWLALAVGARAIFGATDAFLIASGQSHWFQALSILFIACFLAICVMYRPLDAATVAFAYAVSHMITAFLAAIILARNAGIFPGATALLLRQIKLT